ncbi:MAG TPA: LemA family protein [Brumimicrobium sp.]|nr:LemA family protein [Brumimicrobium sp.]
MLTILALGATYVASTYNSIVQAEQAVERQWAQVENAYQSRMDKTKNLLAIVEKAAEFEQETLNQVIEARAKATSVQVNASDLTAENIQAFQNAQDQFGASLSRLLVTLERYPELKATDAYRDFQTQYEGMENRISTERNRFNQEVESFNNNIVVFPKSTIASLFGITKKEYFKSVEGADIAPDIKNM